MLSEAEERQLERYLDGSDEDLEQAVFDAAPSNVRDLAYEKLRVTFADMQWDEEATSAIAMLHRTMVADELDTLLAWQKAVLVEVLCDRRTYCERRSAGGLSVAYVVAEALTGLALAIPLPVTLIAAHLVNKRVLDSWCGCT